MTELTAIGEENREAFEALTNGLNPADHELCIGAISEDEAAGVAFYNSVGDSLMLDYIYVPEKYRRKGIGTALIKDFIEEIREAGPRILYINYPEKADDLYAFTRSLGFMLFRDGFSFRTPVKTLLESEELNKLLKAAKGYPVKPLNKLTKGEKDGLRAKLEKNDMEPSIIDNSSLSDELSLTVLDEKTKEVVSVVLCIRSRKQILIDFMANYSSNPACLIDLMRALKKAVEKEKLGDSDLIFVAMDETMERLPKKLIGPRGIMQEEGPVISGVLKITGADI